MGLTYVVLTMVNRDDLLDGGAEQVAATVRRIKELRQDMLVETLVGDFQGHRSAIDVVVDAAPDVFAHNVEVVRSQTRTMRDARCGYEQSLEVLRYAKQRAPERPTKSSVMVGVGETDAEVLETLDDLRRANVDIVTIGQYLRPSAKHHAVERFVTPDTFEAYRAAGAAMGFAYVASGPLVRSSYKAAEVFIRGMLKGGEGEHEKLIAERVATARREAARVAASLGASTPPRGEAHAAASILGGQEGNFVPASRLLRR